MPVYRDEAVVLRTHKLGEADRIVTLLTRQHGKVRAVAKGVRRTASKFGARLEPFMVADLQLYEGRSLDIVTQAESLGSYGAEISQDYAATRRRTRWSRPPTGSPRPRGRCSSTCCSSARCASLARGEHGAGLTLDSYLLRALALAGMGAELRGLRALRPRRRAHGGRRAARRRRLRRVRPAGDPAHRASSVVLLGALLAGDWNYAETATAPTATRPAASSPPTRSGTSSGDCARCRTSREKRPHVSPKPYTHRDAVPYKPVDWTGLYPPAFPKGAVPEHVAIVMDGNGRWANRRGLTRIEGHKAGEAALLDVVAGAIQAGVKHLSVYAFSTENWKRSPDEVRFLMGYNRDVLHRRRDQLNEWGVRIRWAGRRPRLWASVINELQFAEKLTAGNDTLTLTMCVNYGGRNELTDAVRSIADDVASGRLKPSAVSEKLIQKRLYVPELPDVDLFVRSSGEQRTSNFLLWQSAYAEMVFLDTLWPDFSRTDLWQAIDLYAARNRRFGGAIDAPTV